MKIRTILMKILENMSQVESRCYSTNGRINKDFTIVVFQPKEIFEFKVLVHISHMGTGLTLVHLVCKARFPYYCSRRHSREQNGATGAFLRFPDSRYYDTIAPATTDANATVFIYRYSPTVTE